MLIYMATNKINGKAYIGLTSKTFEIRKYQHIYHARKNKAKVGDFHDALIKYGTINFTWKVLYEDENLSSYQLAQIEIAFIKRYGTFRLGYNQTPGGNKNTRYPKLDRAISFVNLIEDGKYVKPEGYVWKEKTTKPSIKREMYLTPFIGWRYI